MKYFTLLSKRSIHPAPEQKVIKEKSFSTLEKAEEILHEVKKEAKEYREKTVMEAEVLKEKAEKEGFEKGLATFNEKLIQLDKEMAKIEKDAKEQIIPIALKAAKKILGDELKLHPDRIVDIVIQALKPVFQHHHVTIYANKADIEELTKNKKKLASLFEHLKSFSIQERDDIESGGCMIETEAGIINAQLENQWRALESAFKAFMKRKS